MHYTETHKRMLLSRAQSEIQAEHLAAVLGQTAYVIFDTLTGYNHLAAHDEIDAVHGAALAQGNARIVYTAAPPDDLPAREAPAALACQNCGGAHHVQRCPELWRALREPRIPLRMAAAALGLEVAA